MIFKNYALLNLLKSGDLSHIPVGSHDIESFFNHPMRGYFNEVIKNGQMFLGDIKYLSNPFMSALDASYTSFVRQFSELVFNLKSGSGVLIMNNLTIAYELTNNGDGVLSFGQVVFCQNALYSVGGVRFDRNGGQEAKNIWISEQTKAAPALSIAATMLSLLFMQFAELEIKEIEPNKKVTDGKEKHKNETDFKIEVIGCTWFTTIIRNQGFRVSGHFRLQPCGEGLKDRKLIWINDFEKHGYTRRAQIIINNGENENV